MIKLNEILSNKILKEDLNNTNAIIYFLINEDRIVYVGKSVNGISRLIQHIQSDSKIFDSYYYINVDRMELDFLESEYIKEFKPFYNIKLKKYRPTHIQSMLL